MTRIVIIGGGPGGYEAALVAKQLDADVVLIERSGIGGAAVLTDVVPSKTLLATASAMKQVQHSPQLGLGFELLDDEGKPHVRANLASINERVRRLAQAQSFDIRRRLEYEGVQVVDGLARLTGPSSVSAQTEDGERHFDADYILLAVGASPRELAQAKPDGQRILTWKQLYDLDELPSKLIVVGSGVTGTEFVNAYDNLGIDVTLVSSRDIVLPGEDPDAAVVLQDLFDQRGVELITGTRAVAATNTGDGVEVELSDGRILPGSHVLMAVGSTPNTADLGLAEAGVQLTDSGHIKVDRVSRTTARGIYAAGDCTGVLPLASVAAMQGRIAMWHALGEAVAPLDVRTVSSNVFTDPQIATVGVGQEDVDSGKVPAISVMLPLTGNSRSKMQELRDGFVKIFCRPATGNVIGAVVVAPDASELIYPLTIAVHEQISVDRLASIFTVYPSLSGSIAEAARRLRVHGQAQTNQQIRMMPWH